MKDGAAVTGGTVLDGEEVANKTVGGGEALVYGGGSGLTVGNPGDANPECSEAINSK